MNVGNLRKMLETNSDLPLQIMLPNGECVDPHFHITEVGKSHKDFIDCGGTRREVTTCTLQVWLANDIEHRLNSAKLANILKIADEARIITNDLSVEVEYQTDSVSLYPLEDVVGVFVLPGKFAIGVTPNSLLLVLGVKKTECLAPDKCGVSNCCGA